MNRLKSLAICSLVILLAKSGFCQIPDAGDEIKQRVDSLFILACGGLERYRDQAQPAESTLVEMGKQAVPYLVEKLTTQSAREKWTLIRIFGKIGEPAVLPVIGRLESDDKEETKLAIRVLGEIKDNQAVEPLLGLISNQDYNIRSHVCESLGKIADTTGFNDVSVRMKDSVEVVRKSAAVALGKIKDIRAIPHLIRGLSDPHFSVRMSSAHSLVQMGEPAVKPLISLLDHSVGPALDLAIESLGELKDKRAVPYLLEKLKDQNWATRAFAVEALGNMGDQRGVQAIRKMKEEETHPFVLSKIAQSLQKSN